MDSIHNTLTPEVVHGYKILESTVFVNDRGFALAENPEAPQPFVTWQFTETDSGRDYYWGHYKTDADNARQDFRSRVQEYRDDYDLAEKLPPIDQPGEHGYSSKFAEELLDSMEDTQQRSLFSLDEKNLVCNYAFHTGDPTKTRQLAEELAAARFGMQYGGVHPASADRVNAEIAAIDERWARLDAVSPIAAVEMSTEQNLNMIDGVRNNMAVPSVDLTDAQQDLAYWTAVTESSRFKWTEDEIVRLNGCGAMYYIGGEDGQFIEIGKDGLLTAGTYEGAIPHIGDAMFRVAVEKKYPDFDTAFAAALEAGGKKFLADMFSRNPIPRPRAEKPSVVSRIQEARLTPTPPKEPHAPKKATRGEER